MKSNIFTKSSTMFSLIFIFMICLMTTISAAGDFYKDVDITWGNQNAQIQKGGQLLTLSLDQSSGSGFQSKNEYLFGRFDMQLKLVPSNSAGTVTTFYVPFEIGSVGACFSDPAVVATPVSPCATFFQCSIRNPYTVHTNVYAQGKGDKEQQFQLWFDPTMAFHTYSIVWNAQRIIFLVDNIPIRVHNNNKAIGVPFPTNQPMRVYSSLWNADDWATQGGRVKTDWTKAPFTASYRNFSANANACFMSSCGSTDTFSNQAWQTQQLDGAGRNRIRWVQAKHMIYNYCTDTNRFPQGLPKECRLSRFL